MMDFQRRLLADVGRNRAFAEALQRVVTPGCTVADIGAGTGYLSFLARKLGAGPCHLYEVDPAAVELARKLLAGSRLRGIHLHHAFSTDVPDPVKADVVVTETLGNFALEERILETVRDAARFLKPRGVLLPQALDQWVAPVVSTRMFDELNPWAALDPDPGVSYAAASEACFHNMYVRTVPPAELWPGDGAAQRWDTIDFRARGNKSTRTSTVEWTAPRAMTLAGACLWWDCAVWEDVRISTSPHAPPTHWEQIYLPVFQPVELQRGDVLALDLRSDSRLEDALRVRWGFAVARRGKRVHEERHDTWKGLA